MWGAMLQSGQLILIKKIFVIFGNDMHKIVRKVDGIQMNAWTSIDSLTHNAWHINSVDSGGFEIGQPFTKRRKILATFPMQMYIKFVLANHFCLAKS